MLLFLVRHGIAVERDASPEAAEAADRLRPLTRRGEARVREVAEGLRRLGVRPDWVLTSGLSRARRTAALLARTLRVPERRIRLTEVLEPDAAPRRLLAEVAVLEAQSVLCAGHAPHLDRVLALALTGRPTPFTGLRKAGAACLEIEPGTGAHLRWLIEPRMLRRLGR